MKNKNAKSSGKARGRAAYLLAPALCLVSLILGIIARRTMTPPAAAVVLWAYGLPFLILLILEIANFREMRRYARMSVREIQDFMLTSKDEISRMTDARLHTLRLIRTASDIWAILLGSLAVGSIFLAGLEFGAGVTTPLWFLSSLMLLAAFGRVRRTAPKEALSAESGYVPRSELPQLYALADRAAHTLNCRNEIHLAPTADFNAGVARVGKAVSLTLSTRLLHILSEDELYAVLLHELSHITGDHALNERQYNLWLEEDHDDRPLAFLTNRFFNYLDAQYSVQYTLYDLAASVQMEAEADRLMAEHASKASAGSALLKLKYYDLFLWESEAYFAHDTLDKTLSWMVRDEADAFLAALPARKEAWRALMHKEILANNATHPTMQMRLEAIGALDAEAAAPNHSDAYAAEIAHAQSLLKERLTDINEENAYNDRIDRQRKTLAAWEAEGKPLVVEEYSDVVQALRDLGRLDEAIALCERAIRDFDADTPTGFPYYFRGCYRLHRWDDSGLDDIYRAFRQSSSGSMIEEGLEQIGTYCCITGNETELERYREEAVRLMQKERDVYSELGVLRRSDELRAEKLPEELHSSLYRYIRSFTGDAVEAIYLVRKVISEDFFTSVMIVRFADDADEDARAEIMHKIFNVLDNNTHWQFSLFEYTDVQHVHPEQIPGSLFLEKAQETE